MQKYKKKQKNDIFWELMTLAHAARIHEHASQY